MNDSRALPLARRSKAGIGAGWIAFAAATACSAPAHRTRAPLGEPVVSTAAKLQDAPPTELPAEPVRENSYFLEPGIGFTAGPDTFLTALTAGFYTSPGLSLGPTLQLGISDDETLFAPTFGVRRVFDLAGEELDRLAPYIEGGAGFIYLEEDRRRGDDDDLGFLLNFGFGGNVELERNLVVGTGILINVMPGEVLDERLFLSWRVLQIQLSF